MITELGDPVPGGHVGDLLDSRPEATMTSRNFAIWLYVQRIKGLPCRFMSRAPF